MEAKENSQPGERTETLADSGDSTAIRSGHVRRLRRSSDQRMVMGACGGLAEYFDLDPTVIRIAFAGLALLGGSGFLLYAVLAIIMPSEDQLDAHPREAAKSTLHEAISEMRDTANRTVGWARSKFPWSP